MNNTGREGNGNAVRWKDAKQYVLLEAPTPFSFQETLLFLNRNDNEVLHRIKGQSVEKAVCLSGTELLLQVTQPEPDHLKVAFPQTAACRRNRWPLPEGLRPCARS